VTAAREASVAHAPGAGLCTSCVHQQTVTSARGSVFSLCRRSLTDPAFPKYPPLPVLRCAGFLPAPEDDDREAG